MTVEPSAMEACLPHRKRSDAKRPKTGQPERARLFGVWERFLPKGEDHSPRSPAAPLPAAEPCSVERRGRMLLPNRASAFRASGNVQGRLLPGAPLHLIARQPFLRRQRGVDRAGYGVPGTPIILRTSRRPLPLEIRASNHSGPMSKIYARPRSAEGSLYSVTFIVLAAPAVPQLDVAAPFFASTAGRLAPE